VLHARGILDDIGKFQTWRRPQGDGEPHDRRMAGGGGYPWNGKIGLMWARRAWCRPLRSGDRRDR
jgi:hypothetical protein